MTCQRCLHLPGHSKQFCACTLYIPSISQQLDHQWTCGLLQSSGVLSHYLCTNFQLAEMCGSICIMLSVVNRDNHLVLDLVCCTPPYVQIETSYVLCTGCKKNHGNWLSSCGDMLKDVPEGSCVNSAAAFAVQSSQMAIQHLFCHITTSTQPFSMIFFAFNTPHNTNLAHCYTNPSLISRDLGSECSF